MNVEWEKYIRKAADDVRNLCAVSAYGIGNLFLYKSRCGL